MEGHHAGVQIEGERKFKDSKVDVGPEEDLALSVYALTCASMMEFAATTILKFLQGNLVMAACI